MPNVNCSDTNVETARKCLGLIRDIAARGASSGDPEVIGYALQELSQVLLERTGTEERIFEPVPAGEIENLAALYEELEFVDHASEGLEAQTSLRSEGHPDVSKAEKPAAAGAGRAEGEGV
jgi:hypothetical protein